MRPISGVDEGNVGSELESAFVGDWSVGGEMISLIDNEVAGVA